MLKAKAGSWQMDWPFILPHKNAASYSHPILWSKSYPIEGRSPQKIIFFLCGRANFVRSELSLLILFSKSHLTFGSWNGIDMLAWIFVFQISQKAKRQEWVLFNNRVLLDCSGPSKGNLHHHLTRGTSQWWFGYVHKPAKTAETWNSTDLCPRSQWSFHFSYRTAVWILV